MRGSPWRGLALSFGLALGAWSTPAPWGWLWLLAPAAAAASLLMCWRFGAWGVATPVVLHVGTVLAAGPYAPWAWWVPVSALTGAWMGLREEGGGPAAGQRAWMLLPLALLATSLPWTVSYPDVVAAVQASYDESARQRVEVLRQLGYSGERLATAQRGAEEGDRIVRRVLPHALPSLLFLWIAVLVSAGRALSARIASLARWPELSRRPFAQWRLPDGAIWLLLAGLAIVLVNRPDWTSSGWTLLAVSGLGFCLQGVAVVESLLLARGVPPAIIALTLLFVLVMAMPVFVLASTCVGLSDVWLDFRRLDSGPDADAP